MSRRAFFPLAAAMLVIAGPRFALAAPNVTLNVNGVSAMISTDGNFYIYSGSSGAARCFYGFAYNDEAFDMSEAPQVTNASVKSPGGHLPGETRRYTYRMSCADECGNVNTQIATVCPGFGTCTSSTGEVKGEYFKDLSCDPSKNPDAIKKAAQNAGDGQMQAINGASKVSGVAASTIATQAALACTDGANLSAAGNAAASAPLTNCARMFGVSDSMRANQRDANGGANGMAAMSPDPAVLGTDQAQGTLALFDKNYGTDGNDFVKQLVGASSDDRFKKMMGLGIDGDKLAEAFGTNGGKGALAANNGFDFALYSQAASALAGRAKPPGGLPPELLGGTGAEVKAIPSRRPANAGGSDKDAELDELMGMIDGVEKGRTPKGPQRTIFQMVSARYRILTPLYYDPKGFRVR